MRGNKITRCRFYFRNFRSPTFLEGPGFEAVTLTLAVTLAVTAVATLAVAATSKVAVAQ